MVCLPCKLFLFSANFFPRSYTLIPAAFVLGMGASVLWACMTYYIINISIQYAKEKKKEVTEVSADFFGQFNAVFSTSLILGAVFMSVIFESLKNIGKPAVTKVDTGYMTTDTTVTAINDTSTENATQHQCGLHFEYAQTTSEVEKDSVSDVVLYILYSCFLLFNMLGVALCLCLDEVRGEESTFINVI